MYILKAFKFLMAEALLMKLPLGEGQGTSMLMIQH